jgi:hypothetical protein
MSGGDLSQTVSEVSTSNFIYHYTDQKGLLGIIANRSIWATHFQHLNDESEWKIGCNLYRTYIKELLKDETDMRRLFPCVSTRLPGFELHDTLTEFVDGVVGTTAKQNPFIVCFSGAGPYDLEIGRTAGDDLNQWRAYAGGSGGVAIGFDREELIKRVRALAQEQPISAIALRCIYDHAVLDKRFSEITHEFLAAIEEAFPLKSAGVPQGESEIEDLRRKSEIKFLSDLVVAIAQVKHSAFRSENEHRLIVLPRGENRNLKFRPGKSSLVPYVELSLADKENAISFIRQIIVGPSARKDDAIDALKVLLREHNYTLREDGAEGGVEIKASAIPYRNW